MQWTRLEKISYFLVAVLVLCIPAFYNGFPFLFPDTEGYVSTGFRNVVGAARVWLYGGFLRHISLLETVWLVVFAQGIIVSSTIYLAFKYFLKNKYTYNFFIVYVIVIGSTTGLAFHVSMLMPDIFTPVVVLSFALLLFAKDFSIRDQVLTVILFVMGIGMHNSHIILCLGLILCIIGTYGFKCWRIYYHRLNVSLKKIGFIIALILFSHLSICTLHYSLGGDFTTTRGSQIFLFARLCDFGIAQSYLEESCETSQDPICEHISMLNKSNTFLWGDKTKSYLNRTGGFSTENEVYYAALNKDILTTPKYLKKYIIKSIEAMFMQFFTYKTRVPEEAYGINNGWVKAYYPTYEIAAQNSRQSNKRYTSTSMERENAVESFVLGFAILLFLFFLWSKEVSNRQKSVAIFMLMALLINAFIAGATSGVYDRYQSRVAWLLTLPAFWYLCAKIETFGKMLSISKDTTIEKDAS